MRKTWIFIAIEKRKKYTHSKFDCDPVLSFRYNPSHNSLDIYLFLHWKRKINSNYPPTQSFYNVVYLEKAMSSVAVYFATLVLGKGGSPFLSIRNEMLKWMSLGIKTQIVDIYLTSLRQFLGDFRAWALFQKS